MAEALARFADASPTGTAPIGEFVVVLAGAEQPKEADDDAIRDALGDAFSAGASTRDAVDLVVKKLGVAKRITYRIALALNEEGRS